MRGIIEKVDYVGFTYKNYHTSQFGLKSASDGSRYSRDLLPSSDEYTTDVIGGDGTYFFGSKLTNRTFNFNLVFDTLTEQELRELGRWLYNDGLISPLILDETPYIQYYVKLQNRPQIKFVPFEDDYGARVYKGELNVEFVAYDPYGYAPYKWLSSYTDANIGEWSAASRLLTSNTKNGAAYYDVYAANKIPLYNPGDVATDFILTMSLNANKILIITLTNIGDFTLNFSSNTVASQVKVDTKKRLITKSTDSWATYTVENDKLSDGDFFKIPVSIETISPIYIGITNVTAASIIYSYKFI